MASPTNSLSMVGTGLSGGSIHSNDFWNKWYVNGAFPLLMLIILKQTQVSSKVLLFYDSTNLCLHKIMLLKTNQ